MTAINEAKNYKVTIVVNRRVEARTYYTGDEQHRTTSPDCSEGFYRHRVIDEIIVDLHRTLGEFTEAVITLNGDIIIVDSDDVESGVVAVVKEVMAI